MRGSNQKLVPGLATSWRSLDDLTWEFKLRKNVKFHDGTPFTAEDVVATYKRVPNVPNSPSSMATFTRPIVDTKIVDPHTIVFKTAAPHVLLPSDLGAVYILPKAIAERTSGGFAPAVGRLYGPYSSPVHSAARGPQGALRLLGRRGAMGQVTRSIRRPRASPRASATCR